MPFCWTSSPLPSSSPSHQRKTREATRDDSDRDLTETAALMARLGVPRVEAQQRILARIAWEHELGRGPAPAASRVKNLIKAAYTRLGRANQ